MPHALRNVLTGDISKVLDVIEIRPRSADGPQGAFLRLETPGITRPIQKHRAGKRVHASRASTARSRAPMSIPASLARNASACCSPGGSPARQGRVRGHARAFGESYTSVVGG